MSEHPYYTFEAVDQRLTPAEQAPLRATSSWAKISATRFVDTYNYGKFALAVDAVSREPCSVLGQSGGGEAAPSKEFETREQGNLKR
ncbi:MAG: hypothetical protein ACRYGP_09540 [Janthinobacterium lividum]